MSLNLAMSEGPPMSYEEETRSNRLARKTQELPFFPVAIGVCLITCAYGAYMYKRRGKMSTSVYLMQLRVAAQGLAVGCLTAGLAYTIVRENFFKEDEQKRDQ